MPIYRHLSALSRRHLLQSVGIFSLTIPATAAFSDTAVETFLEIKGADLLTLGESGTQLVQLTDRRALRVELEELYMQGEAVFISAELAAALQIPPLQLGNQIDVVEIEPTHTNQPHGFTSMLASSAGTIAATLVVSSAMEDLSDDLFEISDTALDTINDSDADEALDAAEDRALDDEGESEEPTEENPASPPPENAAPLFGTAPTNGTVSETAEAGDATGAIVAATDPEGKDVFYALIDQQIEGALSVDADTGAIKVADPSKLDFEQNPTLEITVSATDADGFSAEQTVTIAIEDDPTDTLDSTPTKTIAHDPFSSGAFVLGDNSTAPVRFGHAGVLKAEGDSEPEALVELYTDLSSYLNNSETFPLPPIQVLSASPFDALIEINTAELTGTQLVLTSTPEKPENMLTVDVNTTDFSGVDAVTFPSRIKTVDADVNGVAEEMFSFADGIVAKLSPTTFNQTTAEFDVEPGDVIHFADLTGDDLADLILKRAGESGAEVYAQTATGFDTDPMEQTIFSGVDLDDLAGGRLLDLSVRNHWATETMNVMLLGEDNAYLYELT